MLRLHEIISQGGIVYYNKSPVLNVQFLTSRGGSSKSNAEDRKLREGVYFVIKISPTSYVGSHMFSYDAEMLWLMYPLKGILRISITNSKFIFYFVSLKICSFTIHIFMHLDIKNQHLMPTVRNKCRKILDKTKWS